MTRGRGAIADRVSVVDHYFRVCLTKCFFKPLISTSTLLWTSLALTSCNFHTKSRLSNYQCFFMTEMLYPHCWRHFVHIVQPDVNPATNHRKWLTRLFTRSRIQINDPHESIFAGAVGCSVVILTRIRLNLGGTRCCRQNKG